MNEVLRDLATKLRMLRKKKYLAPNKLRKNKK
jgi:hypothetical protein